MGSRSAGGPGSPVLCEAGPRSRCDARGASSCAEEGGDDGTSELEFYDSTTVVAQASRCVFCRLFANFLLSERVVVTRLKHRCLNAVKAGKREEKRVAARVVSRFLLTERIELGLGSMCSQPAVGSAATLCLVRKLSRRCPRVRFGAGTGVRGQRGASGCSKLLLAPNTDLPVPDTEAKRSTRFCSEHRAKVANYLHRYSAS